MFGTLGMLAWIAFDFVSVQFRLGTRFGIRSAAGIALPMVAGGYAFAAHRGFVRRLRDLPAGVRFSASLLAGALVMASIRFFLVLYPFLISELVVASCIALLVFASGAFPGISPDEPGARRPRRLRRSTAWRRACCCISRCLVFRRSSTNGGPHYCLGANLARQEMACMLDALLDVVPPGSRVREDQLEFRDVGLFRRAINLPVEIGPRPTNTEARLEDPPRAREGVPAALRLGARGRAPRPRAPSC